jgi:hypothetical protein
MTAEPVLIFQSPTEHYTADACVVWCFDDRFYKLLKAFGKQREFKNIDLVKVAGGAKALAGGPSADREFILNQVKASIRLHDAKNVILMVHRDCGAYGGSKNFQNAGLEEEHHVAQLAAAKHFLAEHISIPVVAHFADFDGLYEVA